MCDEADRMLEIIRQTVRSELSRDEADLTLRQLAVFLMVYQTAEPQTVRALAKTLSIGKPVVTRSLNRLGDADLVKRACDPADGRSILVMWTDAGTAMMHRLSQAMATAIQPQPQATSLRPSEK